MSSVTMNTFEEPTVQDVLRVKSLLEQAPSSMTLPLELIDIILDYAEYWPHTTNSCQLQDRNIFGSPHGTQVEDKLLARSVPLGCPSDGRHDGELKFNTDYSTQSPALTPPELLLTSAHEQAVRHSYLNYWSTHTLPRGNNPCRKIVFTLKSHDQGWGGDRATQGTYRGSHTWFDVGLERVSVTPPDLPVPFDGLTKESDHGGLLVYTAGVKDYYTLQTISPPTVPIEGSPQDYKFDHPFLAGTDCLQRNVTATGATKEHVITWSRKDSIDPDSLEGIALEQIGRGRASGTGEFVRNLQIGDVVTVWGRSRFPGWKNVVEDVKIDVYWAV